MSFESKAPIRTIAKSRKKLSPVPQVTLLNFFAVKPPQEAPSHSKSIPSSTKASVSTQVNADVLTPTHVAKHQLGGKQAEVYDLVVNRKQSLFFTGSAGTGKSYLLRSIIAGLQEQQTGSIAVTASTGIAAMQIGGQTIHHFAGIQLGDRPLPQLKQMAYRARRSIWRECEVLIIDEIGMISGRLFDDLEEIARYVRGISRPFGGIQLVVCGDFFQLPPVNSAEGFAFQASSWSRCIKETVELDFVYRQRETEFVDHLNQIRHGLCPESTLKFFSQARRPLPMIDGILPTRLYCTNARVDEENQRRLAEIESEEVVFYSVDRTQEDVIGKNKAQVWSAIQQSQRSSTMTKSIHTKIGAQVMLLRNMSRQDLVNGSRGVIDSFKEYHAENFEDLLDNVAHDTDPSIHRRDLEKWLHHQVQRNGNEPTKLLIRIPVVRFVHGVTQAIFPILSGVVVGPMEHWYRIQVPLRLAWAITVHKSQGMTLDRCQLNLSRAFAAGQAYVALSRVSSLQGLELDGFSQQSVFSHPDVLKYYAEVCSDPISQSQLPLIPVSEPSCK